MIINSQGFGHFTQGLNNQDFGIETPRMLLILDGCSEAKHSEVGTKLFGQLFSRKEESDKLETFEDNVKIVFEDILSMFKKYYPTQEDLEEFIMDNLLFTIIACFETENEYIVKLFGDGYIITQNMQGRISYMKFSYGKCPPYFAYRYCESPNAANFKEYNFKTFRFDKKVFPKIAIATDGIIPFVKGIIKIGDACITEGNEVLLKLGIQNTRQSFDDDITIGAFGGKKE